MTLKINIEDCRFQGVQFDIKYKSYSIDGMYTFMEPDYCSFYDTTNYTKWHCSSREYGNYLRNAVKGRTCSFEEKKKRRRKIFGSNFGFKFQRLSVYWWICKFVVYREYGNYLGNAFKCHEGRKFFWEKQLQKIIWFRFQVEISKAFILFIDKCKNFHCF